MNHEQYKELLQLSLYDELDRDEAHTLEKHLAVCKDCRSELEELKNLHSALAQHRPPEVTEQLLQETRQELRVALRNERVRQSGWEKLAERARDLILPQYKIAFGAVATLAVGILLGYLVFAPSSTQRVHEQPPLQVARETPQGLKESTRITNVRFINSDVSSGEVEFMFEAVKPVRMEGSVNDPEIQKVLAYALLNDQNPGVRLRSVDAIGSEQLKQPAIEGEIKEALIAALKSDENPGVRKEALAVLQKFPFDDETKRVFLDVLIHDNNSGLRIAAINALEAARGESRHLDQEVLNVLKEKMRSDENNYIRLRARAVVEEMKQQ